MKPMCVFRCTEPFNTAVGKCTNEQEQKVRQRELGNHLRSIAAAVNEMENEVSALTRCFQYSQ